MRVYFAALAVLLSVVGSAFGVYAQTADEVIKTFRQYQDITSSYNVPTVLEVPLQGGLERPYDVAILDEATTILQPVVVRQQKNSVGFGAYVHGDVVPPLTDSNSETSYDFDLPETGEGRVDITLRASVPVTSTSLVLALAPHVALPRFIEVRATTVAGQKIVVARSRMEGLVTQFPKTTAAEWLISLTYAQPLRIAELTLVDDAQKIAGSWVRFLAQPAHTYRMYFDADRSLRQRVGEGGNLENNEGVRRIASFTALPNPLYVIADTDRDGVPDIHDNCVEVTNANQQDVDGNGRGDACDDFDRDGLINILDNCPNSPNRYQEDNDGDTLGDVCDAQESRVTEKYAWLPWLGMGGAALVLIILFVLTIKKTLK